MGRLKVYLVAKLTSVLAVGEEEARMNPACSGWWTLEKTKAVR